MGSASARAAKIRKYGAYIPKGTLELWCFEELVRVKQFYDHHQRRAITNEWNRDLQYGSRNKGYYFIIKLDI